MDKNNQRDFSIREEVRIVLEENDLDLSVDDIFEEVENDELMLDIIALSIYEAILETLEKKGIHHEAVENRTAQLRQFAVSALKDRGII
jgi:hypothetical protein